MRKQNKKIYIILLILLIIPITFLLISNYSNKENNIEFNPIISKMENGNYYIFGASRDYSFEIEKSNNYSFKIMDEDNNEIIPIVEILDDKVIIKAPKDLYEEGKTYILTIENTKFVSEDFKESNVVEFSIVRKASNSYEYKENINKVSPDDVVVINNIMTTKNKYNVDDIIVLEDSNIKALYKVLNNNNDGTYEVTSAELDDVFSKYDYYKVEYVDLSSFETDKELQNYLLYNVKKSILNYFIDEVNAEPKIKIESSNYNKETGKITLKLEASTEAGDKFFNLKFLENHDLKLTFEVSISLKLYSDITLTKYDIALELDLDINPKFEIASRNKFIKELKDIVDSETKDGSYVDSWINLVDINGDVVESDLEFGKIAVPTTVPGLYMTVNTSMLYELDLKASFETDAKTNIVVNLGVRNSQKNRKNGIYGNYKTTGSMSIGAGGKFETKLGLKNTAGMEFVNLIALTGNVESGIYTEGLVYVKVNEKNNDNPYPSIESNIEGGLFAGLNINARIFGTDITKKLYEAKVPLLKINETIKFNQEISPVIKEEYNDNEYIVKLYGFGNCSGEYGEPPTVKLIDTYEIKDNEKLNDNKELMNNQNIIELSYETNIDENSYHYGLYTYNDFSKYLEEVDKTYKQYQKCKNKCISDYGEDNSYSCILDNCQVYDTYKVKLPKSFDLNQKIDKDIDLVVGPVGCGDS